MYHSYQPIIDTHCSLHSNCISDVYRSLSVIIANVILKRQLIVLLKKNFVMLGFLFCFEEVLSAECALLNSGHKELSATDVEKNLKGS